MLIYVGVKCVCVCLWVFLNRGFSNTETLCSEYKYYCEQCRSKQEAQKRFIEIIS